ncbi:MAG: hypothetical protein ACRYG8_13605, partial [Janthinobacterium lividum]
ASCLAMSTAAFAVPVSGEISVSGFAQAVGSTGMGAATGISFADASGTSVTGTSGLLSNYGAGSGSFVSLGSCASVTSGCGTIRNIASFASQGSLNGFLTLATTNGSTISFDLTSITNVTRPGSTNQIGFTANGFINYTGFDRTAGAFKLTAQGNNITSFSANTSVTNVAEPGSVAILGGSFAAIGLIRRKKA